MDPTTVGLPDRSLERRARRSHRKSKTGCQTCRTRKVKCDERRPLCRNCERHYENVLSCDFDGQSFAFETSSQTTPHVRDVTAQPSSSSVPPAVASGRLDPFETYPARTDEVPQIDSLMQHYLSSFAYRNFPFYASRALLELWWPFVREDDLLFHVTMLLTAVDETRLRQRDPLAMLPVWSRYNAASVADNSRIAIELVQMKQNCVAMLSRRMENPQHGIDDHMLVSIAYLAALEHEGGDIRGLNLHLRGLKDALALHNGLAEVRENNPLAADLIRWVMITTSDEISAFNLDEMAAEALQGPFNSPYLPETDFAGPAGTYVDLGVFGVDDATAKTLSRVRLLSEGLFLETPPSTAPEAQSLVTIACDLVSVLLAPTDSASGTSRTLDISKSCRTASCLHILGPLSGYFPRPFLLLHSAVRELKSVLGRLIRQMTVASSLLLWLLSVGGITAHRMLERSWFVNHLVAIATDLHIGTWDEFKSHLVNLALHTRFCDISFHQLWEEVLAKQKHLQGLG